MSRKKQAATAPALDAELLAFIEERAGILAWLETAQAREMELRKYIAAVLFPNPEEGANRLFTEDGYEIYLDHKVNRKLDEAMIDTVMQELPEDCDARVPGVLINYKPSLVLTGYRNLPEDQLKIVQQMVTESDGAPTLAIAKAEPTPPLEEGEVTQRMRDVAEAHGHSETPTPIMDAYEKAKEASTQTAEPAKAKKASKKAAAKKKK